MNYKKIIKNFSSINIPVEDFYYLRKNAMEKRVFEIMYGDNYSFRLSKIPYCEEFNRAIQNTILKDDYKKYVKSITLKKNGLFINVNDIINELCNIYNIDNDDNLLIKINEINNSSIRDFKQKNINNIQSYQHYIESKGNKIGYHSAAAKLKTELKIFENFILNRNKFKVDDYKDILDENNTKVYIANVILKEAKNNKDNKDYYKECINYLESFYLDMKNFKEKVYVYKNEFSVDTIKKYLEKINNNKEEINYDYSFFEQDYNDYKNNILSFLNNNNKTQNIDILKRKIDFYDKLGHKRIRIGKDSFNGFIGYDINDKYVILDKLFNKDNSISNNNALFIIKIDDFETITKMSRYEVGIAIKEKRIEAKKINHNFSFEKRTLEEINRIIKL